MRRRATYPAPRYVDPRDKRLASIIELSKEAASGAVNIMGVPYDGAVLGRKGAKDGPAAIRNALRFFSNYNPELRQDLLKAKIVDLGDVVIKSQEVNRVHREVKKEVADALSRSSLLVMLGGDNSLSLPSLAACAERFGRLGVIVFDSHFDVREPMDGEPTSGSSYGTAVRTLQGLRGSRLVEIGIHGFLNSREYAEEARRLHATVFTARDVSRLGGASVVRRAYEIASRGADGVYVSVDLDSVDASSVSGVSAPSFGGLAAEDLFEMLHRLGGRDKVVCSDIVELAPSLDPTGRSEIVAATALVYLAAGFATRPRRHR